MNVKDLDDQFMHHPVYQGKIWDKTCRNENNMVYISQFCMCSKIWTN